MAMIRNRKRIVRWFFIISSPPVCSGKNGEHYAGKVKELWKRGEGTVTEAKMREICIFPSLDAPHRRNKGEVTLAGRGGGQWGLYS